MTIASEKLCGKNQLFAPHILLMMKLCHVYEGYGFLFSITTDNLLDHHSSHFIQWCYILFLVSGATGTTEGSSIFYATTEEVRKVEGSYMARLNGP